MLRAVTFDFWGTLVDGGHSLKDERVRALCQRLVPCVAQDVLYAYEESWKQFGRALSEGYGMGAATLLSGTLDILGRTLLPPDYASTLRYWEEALLSDPPPLLDGVRSVLYAMRARDLWVGLISDTGASPGRVIRQVLRDAGLLVSFDWLTFSNEIGVTKRRPQPFMLTLRALGVRPEEALHVGDLPETDIQGARAMGMHTPLLLENSGRRDGIPDADIVLERLRDLPEALECWEQEWASQAR